MNDAVLPVVARVSDVGSDESPLSGLKLGRLALKMPWAAAWDGEINLLFTSDLCVFAQRNMKSMIGGRTLSGYARRGWVVQEEL